MKLQFGHTHRDTATAPAFNVAFGSFTSFRNTSSILPLGSTKRTSLRGGQTLMHFRGNSFGMAEGYQHRHASRVSGISTSASDRPIAPTDPRNKNTTASPNMSAT